MQKAPHEAETDRREDVEAAAEGEEVKLSKKDLAKAAKKESKANAKAGIPQEAKPKGKPQGKPAGATE